MPGIKHKETEHRGAETQKACLATHALCVSVPLCFNPFLKKRKLAAIVSTIRIVVWSTIIFNLMMTGCDQQDRSIHPPVGKRVRTATKLFGAGNPAQFDTRGVYADFYKSHGVFLVNNRSMLVALCAESPNSGNTVRYDRNLNQYIDPRDNSRYTADGLPTGRPNDRQALERCRISMSLELSDQKPQLVIDPTHRFLYEKNEWSNYHSFHDLRTPPPEKASRN